MQLGEVTDSSQNGKFLRDCLLLDQSQPSTPAARFSFLYFKRMNLQMLSSGYFAGYYFCINQTLNRYLITTHSSSSPLSSFGVVGEDTEEHVRLSVACNLVILLS